MAAEQHQTALQHHVEIGADPHAAADVLAALIRSDRRSGVDLPDGLPAHVVYEEPHGPDRIPAPATVAREGTAACGAHARAAASKEQATHVGVCQAVGPDKKPVHHAFLMAAAKPGEAPLVTGPDGKSLGPVDLKRVRDPSKDRGMNCGCDVPDHLYQGAAFRAIEPDAEGGVASPLRCAPPAERAAAGAAWQGSVRTHRPETAAGRAVTEAALLAARAMTPPPGHAPRPADELHPHPAVPHPEADHPLPAHAVPVDEHLDRMTGEFVGALHTVASGLNPHPLPEDPPVTEAHADAARKMVGTLVNVANATPAHELHDDPDRQAQHLALVVPEPEQRRIREKMLRAAGELEHLDGQKSEEDSALTVASELHALLPGVLPPEVGDALRRRRANARDHYQSAALSSPVLVGIGSESAVSLAAGLALMVALDDWHVGCPWDGRRAPPPGHPARPTALSDAPIAGVSDAPMGHAGSGGHGGGGHGGRRGGGGFAFDGLSYIDCGQDSFPLDLDPILGDSHLAQELAGKAAVGLAPVGATTLPGVQAANRGAWNAGQPGGFQPGGFQGGLFGGGYGSGHREPWRRGLVSGPDRPRGWFGPVADEGGAPLVVGRSQKGGGAYTWGGTENGWIPTAAWLAGHLHHGRFVPGPVRDFMVAGIADKDEFLACRLLVESQADPQIGRWGGWDYRGRDRVVRDAHHAGALRRYWRDADFRRRIDGGEVADGWDLAALSEILDPPVAGFGSWWRSLWSRGRAGHDPHGEHGAWWRRDKSWDRGWDWWQARIPPEHLRGDHAAWFRRFHDDPAFRRRAEAGETIDGLSLAAVLAWARGVVPGSVPDVVLGAWPGLQFPGGYRTGYGTRRYGYGYAQQAAAARAAALAAAQQTTSVDQYGNVLDQYGNIVSGPGGGPPMGPNGPMAAPFVPVPGAPVPQVPLYGLSGIPPEMLDAPMQGVGDVADGLQATRRAVRGRPCPTGRCRG